MKEIESQNTSLATVGENETLIDLKRMPKEEYDLFISSLLTQILEYYKNKKNNH